MADKDLKTILGNLQYRDDAKVVQQITEQMAFTPFVFEDPARLASQSNDNLYLFSSDYPHTEGGRDPIARFEACMANSSKSEVEKFNSGNFLRVFPRAK